MFTIATRGPRGLIGDMSFLELTRRRLSIWYYTPSDNLLTFRMSPQPPHLLHLLPLRQPQTPPKQPCPMPSQGETARPPNVTPPHPQHLKSTPTQALPLLFCQNGRVPLSLSPMVSMIAPPSHPTNRESSASTTSVSEDGPASNIPMAEVPPSAA
jgi:hypothetical protein